MLHATLRYFLTSEQDLVLDIRSSLDYIYVQDVQKALSCNHAGALTFTFSAVPSTTTHGTDQQISRPLLSVFSHYVVLYMGWLVEMLYIELHKTVQIAI